MTWLDNPIAHLWGPYFLALYAMVLAIMLAPILWYRRRADQSMELGDLPIPLKIDPYQLAYLRGGLLEVLRLATVDLYPHYSGLMLQNIISQATVPRFGTVLALVSSSPRSTNCRRGCTSWHGGRRCSVAGRCHITRFGWSV